MGRWWSPGHAVAVPGHRAAYMVSVSVAGRLRAWRCPRGAEMITRPGPVATTRPTTAAHDGGQCQPHKRKHSPRSSPWPLSGLPYAPLLRARGPDDGDLRRADVDRDAGLVRPAAPRHPARLHGGRDRAVPGADDQHPAGFERFVAEAVPPAGPGSARKRLHEAHSPQLVGEVHRLSHGRRCGGSGSPRPGHPSRARTNKTTNISSGRPRHNSAAAAASSKTMARSGSSVESNERRR